MAAEFAVSGANEGHFLYSGDVNTICDALRNVLQIVLALKLWLLKQTIYLYKCLFWQGWSENVYLIQGEAHLLSLPFD